MKLRSIVLAVVAACGLAGCGDCGGGLFGGSSEAAAPVPIVTVSVLRDVGDAVFVEVVSSTPGGTCSAEAPRTTRLRWEDSQRVAVTTTAAPTAAARRVTGAMLGGGVTTWESVIPGLTIRAAEDWQTGLTLTFTTASGSSMLTCSRSFYVTCR